MLITIMVLYDKTDYIIPVIVVTAFMLILWPVNPFVHTQPESTHDYINSLNNFTENSTYTKEHNKTEFNVSTVLDYNTILEDDFDLEHI